MFMVVVWGGWLLGEVAGGWRIRSLQQDVLVVAFGVPVVWLAYVSDVT